MNEPTKIPNSSLSPVEKYTSELLGQSANGQVIYRTLMKWDQNSVDDAGEPTSSILTNHQPDSVDKVDHAEPKAIVETDYQNTLEEKTIATPEAQPAKDINTKSEPECNKNNEQPFIEEIEETANAKEIEGMHTPLMPIEYKSAWKEKKDSDNKTNHKAHKKSDKKSHSESQKSMERDFDSPKYFLEWLRSMNALEGSKLLKKQKKKSKIQAIIDKSVEEPVGVASESYAIVLAQQGHIEKAIEMFQQLSLKNPEKSSYFAAQIEKFKNQ